MSVYEAVERELTGWGIQDGTNGQIALTLAAALDDRAGVQNLAATAKQLESVMDGLRELNRPKDRGRLAVLRGITEQTA